MKDSGELGKTTLVNFGPDDEDEEDLGHDPYYKLVHELKSLPFASALATLANKQTPELNDMSPYILGTLEEKFGCLTELEKRGCFKDFVDCAFSDIEAQLWLIYFLSTLMSWGEDEPLVNQLRSTQCRETFPLAMYRQSFYPFFEHLDEPKKPSPKKTLAAWRVLARLICK